MSRGGMSLFVFVLICVQWALTMNPRSYLSGWVHTVRVSTAAASPAQADLFVNTNKWCTRITCIGAVSQTQSMSWFSDPSIHPSIFTASIHPVHPPQHPWFPPSSPLSHFHTANCSAAFLFPQIHCLSGPFHLLSERPDIHLCAVLAPITCSPPPASSCVCAWRSVRQRWDDSTSWDTATNLSINQSSCDHLHPLVARVCSCVS